MSFQVEAIDKVLHEAVVELGYLSLKEKQKQAIIAFLQGRDVFVVFPMGFGKSLCYACLPCAFDRLLRRATSIVIVISPLIALMEDQVKSFSSRGIRSVKAGNCSDETRQKFIHGEYQIVFISPESLLSSQRWRKMLLFWHLEVPNWGGNLESRKPTVGVHLVRSYLICCNTLPKRATEESSQCQGRCIL